MRLLASGAIAGLPGGQQASQILFPSTLMNYAFYGARWLSFLILLGGGSRSGSCPCSPGEETAVRMPDSTPAPPSKALARSRFQRPRMSLALPDPGPQPHPPPWQLPLEREQRMDGIPFQLHCFQEVGHGDRAIVGAHTGCPWRSFWKPAKTWRLPQDIHQPLPAVWGPQCLWLDTRHKPTPRGGPCSLPLELGPLQHQRNGTLIPHPLAPTPQSSLGVKAPPGQSLPTGASWVPVHGLVEHIQSLIPLPDSSSLCSYGPNLRPGWAYGSRVAPNGEAAPCLSWAALEGGLPQPCSLPSPKWANVLCPAKGCGGQPCDMLPDLPSAGFL